MPNSKPISDLRNYNEVLRDVAGEILGQPHLFLSQKSLEL